MILTGKPISAQDAEKWGLVSQVVEPGQLEEAGMKMAKAIAAKSSLMVNWAKQCVHLVRDHDLQSGIQKEMTRFSEAFTTEDSSEGTQAFLEKRKAHFTGK